MSLMPSLSFYIRLSIFLNKNDLIRYSLIVTIVIPVTLFLLKRIFAKKNEVTLYPTNPQRIEKIRKKFKIIELILGLVVAFLPIGIGLLVLLPLFPGLYSIYLNKMQAGTIYFIGTPSPAFIFPLFAIGIVVTMHLSTFLYPLVGKRFARSKEEWEIYYANFNERTGGGIDTDKLAKYITFSLLIFAAVLSFLIFNSYSKITSTSIINNGFFSLTEKEYPFNQIFKIFFVEKFKNKMTGEIEKEGPFYQVIMEDGSSWMISPQDKDISKQVDGEEIIEYISQKSGIPIQSGIANIDF